MMDVRNVLYVSNGHFLCEVKNGNEWIHFTASSDDSEAFGREVYEHILTLPSEDIGVYEAPVRTKREIEALRRAAYANPHTGSDRLFAEAQRMQLMNEDGWEEVRDQAIQRFQEIQNQYPWE